MADENKTLGKAYQGMLPDDVKKPAEAQPVQAAAEPDAGQLLSENTADNQPEAEPVQAAAEPEPAPIVEAVRRQPEPTPEPEPESDQESDESDTDPRVQRANREAARYRVQLREQEAENASLRERLEAIEAQLADQRNTQVESWRQQAIAQYNVPEERREFLASLTSREAIEEAAQKLAGAQTAPRVGNSGPGSRVNVVAERTRQKIKGGPSNFYDPSYHLSGGGSTGS